MNTLHTSGSDVNVNETLWLRDRNLWFSVRDLPHFHETETRPRRSFSRPKRDRDLARVRSKYLSTHSFSHFYMLAIWLFSVLTCAPATLQAVCYLCIAHENDNFLQSKLILYNLTFNKIHGHLLSIST